MNRIEKIIKEKNIKIKPDYPRFIFWGFALLMLIASVFIVLTSTANAGIMGEDFPDVIVCSNATSGYQYVFYVSQLDGRGLTGMWYRDVYSTPGQIAYSTTTLERYDSNYAGLDCSGLDLPDVVALGITYDFVQDTSSTGGSSTGGTLELPDDFYNLLALFSGFIIFLFWLVFIVWFLTRRK